ncbi:MAG: gliding motility-associated C-terminal domain-containing protein [Flavobacteriales bacterium]|nr:gliding motility-associated C-terminal domain-containing protein [Flavobacteriales bacterium]
MKKTFVITVLLVFSIFTSHSQVVTLSFNVDQSIGGNLSIDGVIPASYIFTDDYTQAEQLTLVAVPSIGYLFSNWSSNGTAFNTSSTDDSVTIIVDQPDTIVAHFIEIDTIIMNFSVNPTGGGNVSINGATPPSYPQIAYYTITQTMNLVAIPQPGYVFDKWTATNGTTFSSVNTDNVNSIQIGVSDIITAHFEIDKKLIMFDVSPEKSGTISVDSVSLGNLYAAGSNYINGQTLQLEAFPKSGFSFVSWSSANSTTINPVADTAYVNITVFQPDVITAIFIPDTFEIKYNVDTIVGGDISINGSIPTSYIHSEKYPTRATVILEAINSADYFFSHWETTNHNLSPDTLELEVSFRVTGIDSIVAIFIAMPFEGAFVPSAFSPNGDGNNDYLYVYGGQISTMTLEIFDRWGKKVFKSSDLKYGWDGQYNEIDVNPGVYYYKVDATYLNGNSETVAGDVTLVR